MKACVIHKPFDLRVEEVPTPVISDGEVLIRAAACGICGSDLHIYDGSFFADYPIIPGHEFTGVIQQVGAGVSGLAAGESVVVSPPRFCYSCYHCRRKEFNQCLHKKGYGVRLNGGLAEFAAVDARNVHKLGDFSLIQGALAEPLGCVLHSMDLLGFRPGSDVLLFGVGTMGLLHLQALKMHGARRVVCVDVEDKKLATANELGADFVYNARDFRRDAVAGDFPHGFDYVIDDTGVKSVIESMPQYVARRGAMLLFGVCNEKILLDAKDIFNRELRVIGSCSIELSMQDAVEALLAGAVNTERLISQTITLEEVQTALEAQRQGAGGLKTLVVF